MAKDKKMEPQNAAPTEVPTMAFDDSYRSKIRQQAEREIREIDKLADDPEALAKKLEEGRKKVEELDAEYYKWVEEENDGVDWTLPPDGEEDDYGDEVVEDVPEGYFDNSITQAEEDELWRESEEDYVDTNYMSDWEVKHMFDLPDGLYEHMKARMKEKPDLSEEEAHKAFNLDKLSELQEEAEKAGKDIPFSF